MEISVGCPLFLIPRKGGAEIDQTVAFEAVFETEERDYGVRGGPGAHHEGVPERLL